MGFQYSSLQSTTVTISGGITITPFVSQPNASQTIKHAIATLGNNSVDTIYTVTAGKIFYLMGFLPVYSNDTTITIYETDGATAVVFTHGSGSVMPSGLGSSCPLAAYASGTFVKAKCTGAGGFISIWGYEV